MLGRFELVTGLLRIPMAVLHVSNPNKHTSANAGPIDWRARYDIFHRELGSVVIRSVVLVYEGKCRTFLSIGCYQAFIQSN